jgi:hypothetical protein
MAWPGPPHMACWWADHKSPMPLPMNPNGLFLFLSPHRTCPSLLHRSTPSFLPSRRARPRGEREHGTPLPFPLVARVEHLLPSTLLASPCTSSSFAVVAALMPDGWAKGELVPCASSTDPIGPRQNRHLLHILYGASVSFPPPPSTSSCPSRASSPLAAATSRPQRLAFPSLCSHLVGFRMAWPAKKAVSSRLARHEKKGPNRSCLGRWPGTKPREARHGGTSGPVESCLE